MAPEELVGTVAYCPSCGKEITIPTDTSEQGIQEKGVNDGTNQMKEPPTNTSAKNETTVSKFNVRLESHDKKAINAFRFFRQLLIINFIIWSLICLVYCIYAACHDNSEAIDDILLMLIFISLFAPLIKIVDVAFGFYVNVMKIRDNGKEIQG